MKIIGPSAPHEISETLVSAKFRKVGLAGIEPAASASRTNGGSVLSGDSKQVAPKPASGCTNGCTSFAESAHKAQPELVGLEQSKCLELLAADPELIAVVQAWPELPDAVRAGVRATAESSA
jgi:hypothetical protein